METISDGVRAFNVELQKKIDACEGYGPKDIQFMDDYLSQLQKDSKAKGKGKSLDELKEGVMSKKTFEKLWEQYCQHKAATPDPDGLPKMGNKPLQERVQEEVDKLYASSGSIFLESDRRAENDKPGINPYGCDEHGGQVCFALPMGFFSVSMYDNDNLKEMYEIEEEQEITIVTESLEDAVLLREAFYKLRNSLHMYNDGVIDVVTRHMQWKIMNALDIDEHFFWD